MRDFIILFIIVIIIVAFIIAITSNLNLQKAHYAYEKIRQLNNFEPAFSSPFFNEFVIKCNDINNLFLKMKENDIVPGLDLGKYYPELKNHMLICVTEMHSKEDIDNLIKIMEEK